MFRTSLGAEKSLRELGICVVDIGVTEAESADGHAAAAVVVVQLSFQLPIHLPESAFFQHSLFIA